MFQNRYTATALGLVTLGGFGKLAIAVANDEVDEILYYFRKKVMGRTTPTEKRKVVILGTGWAGMTFAKHLDQDLVDVKVVSPRSHFFYTPLLAGSAVGTVTHPSIMEPIRWYLQGDGSSFIQGQCVDVDLQKKEIICETIAGSKIVLGYDDLIIAVGAEVATFGTPGVSEHAIFMKEVKDSIALQKRILLNLEKASSLWSAGAPCEVIDKLLHWVIVGGGPTGVELSAELSDFIKDDVERYFPHLACRVKVTLIEATGRILSVFSEKMSTFATKTLEDRGAQVLLNTFVTKLTPDTVTVNVKDKDGKMSSQEMSHGMAVWAAGIASRPITKHISTKIGSSIQSSRFGLLVDKKFRVKGVEDSSVWAIGDCAVSGCGPTAQAATQQGAYLGRLFRDTNMDPELIELRPDFAYQNKGALAYVGGSQGVAELKTMLWQRESCEKRGGEKGQGEKEGLDVDVWGISAFAIWRTLYFTKLMSSRNHAQVLFDWGKTSIFGRDISSPDFDYERSAAAGKQPLPSEDKKM